MSLFLGLILSSTLAIAADKRERSLNLERKPAVVSIGGLRVVSALKKQLELQRVIIIFGAPGSGKTEQMELALVGKSCQVFDLRDSFVNYYIHQQGIRDPKKKALIKKKGYSELKAVERAWLVKEKDNIAKKLAATDNSIIVFDEFDLWRDFDPSVHEFESAKAILEIAQGLLPKKTIIFIIHEEGLNSKEFQQELSAKFSIDFSHIIRTGYFTPEEEQFLLSNTSFTESEKKQFMENALGDPSAYLEIIKNLSKKRHRLHSFAKLNDLANKTVDKVYQVIKRTNPSTAKILNNIAEGRELLTSYHNKSVINRLLSTGLIGIRDGTYVMPPLVKKRIQLEEASTVLLGPPAEPIRSRL